MEPTASLASLQRATQNAVLDGPGHLDQSIRQQVALGRPPADVAVLVEKIRDRAYTVTDADIDALRARYSDDQLYELIVAAAIGAAGHRLQRALAALEDA
jgi:alkylhydroperoxidase family enzyme